jgi:hypothetical protein
MRIFKSPLKYIIISKDAPPRNRYELTKTFSGWLVTPQFSTPSIRKAPYKVISMPIMSDWRRGMKIVFLAGRSKFAFLVEDIRSPKGSVLRGTFTRAYVIPKETLKRVWNIFKGKPPKLS